MATFFQLFLPTLTTLLASVSLIVLYWVVKGCKESEFVPTYYFLGLSLVSLLVISVSRLVSTLFGRELFEFALTQDLMLSYLALFIFGALWQSYETSIAVPPGMIDEG